MLYRNLAAIFFMIKFCQELFILRFGLRKDTRKDREGGTHNCYSNKM